MMWIQAQVHGLITSKWAMMHLKSKKAQWQRSKSKKLQEALIGLIQDIWKAQYKNTVPINEGQVEAQRIMFTSSNEVKNKPITNSTPDSFFKNFGKLQRVLM